MKKRNAVMRNPNHLAMLCLVLIATICGVSCSHQADSANNAKVTDSSSGIEDFFPARNGSQWIYSIEYAAFGVGVQKGKLAVRIDGEETINGHQYLRFVTAYSGIPGAESATDFYRKTASGVYIIQGKYRNQPESLYLPLPLEVGKEWVISNPEGTTHYKVESREPAELFDKKYDNCFKISYQQDKKNDKGTFHVNGYKFLAPNIGTVKEADEVQVLSLPNTSGPTIYSKTVKVDSSLESHNP